MTGSRPSVRVVKLTAGALGVLLALSGCDAPKIEATDSDLAGLWRSAAGKSQVLVLVGFGGKYSGILSSKPPRNEDGDLVEINFAPRDTDESSSSPIEQSARFSVTKSSSDVRTPLCATPDVLVANVAGVEGSRRSQLSLSSAVTQSVGWWEKILELCGTLEVQQQDVVIRMKHSEGSLSNLEVIRDNGEVLSFDRVRRQNASDGSRVEQLRISIAIQKSETKENLKRIRHAFVNFLNDSSAKKTKDLLDSDAEAKEQDALRLMSEGDYPLP